jgi:hypothetical protein
MSKYTFQVNLNFGPKVMSASGTQGYITAPNLIGLVRKIQKKYNLKVEQIKLTFQPESTEA